MDADAAQAFFQQVHSTWIWPEVVRRTADGTLPADFKIFRARVLLPKSASPIVEFNDSIAWASWMELGDPSNLKPGDVVYWDEVRRVKSVAAPCVDGVRVAFVYLFKVTKGYQVIFDFSPNWSDDLVEDRPVLDWGETFGAAIARTLQDGLVERSFHLDELALANLAAVGLWPAPALVPYPFGEIARRVATGDHRGASAVLVEHCTPAFVSALVDAWWSEPEFEARKTLLSDAVWAHGAKRYALSIPALLPQLEGLITDWMARSFPAEPLPFRQESKTKRFRELLLAAEGKSFVFRKIVEASLRFILEGPVLSSFRHWHDVVSGVFPNRHVVGHGKQEDEMYTEENSLKLILLIDSLHCMMSGRSPRSDGA
jgi:hypothetical protein